MSVLTISEAKSHQKIDDDDDSEIQRKLESAELMAARFMGRYFYANDADKIAGYEEVASILNEAKTKAAQLEESANNSSDQDERDFYLEQAKQIRRESRTEAAMRINGVLINPLIRAGVLLTFGYLYESREATKELPVSAENTLFPFRINLGV
ncbi:head-tail connector protein [Acinetobacter lactucae]|uniref:head-tail connector protein n=1 Tax=Acinetobacter lactucae TaxID=1785128 RepID=UPI00237BEE5B|nr:head-tail connector protein [Acinetobacter lactucae]MDD9317866.1 phage gp6-like head-tail connector protein [Acinetobacter lactucae]